MFMLVVTVAVSFIPVLFFFVFLDMVSLHNLDYPGTLSEDQGDLELR